MQWILELRFQYMREQGLIEIFITDPNSKIFFVKQIIAGAFITITMTGMDQEMMQKNISVRTLKDSQKNMVTLSIILLVVILMFLFLGGLLYLYAGQFGVTAVGDQIIPGSGVGTYAAIYRNHFHHSTYICFISQCRWRHYCPYFFFLYRYHRVKRRD